MAVSGGGGGGATGGAIRAGRAYVELSLRDSAFARSLAKAQRAFKAFSVGAAAGAATTAALVAESFREVVDRGTEFQRLSEKLGVPVDQLTAFAYAAETTGVSLDDLKGHFENFQERVAQAAQGAGEGAAAFQLLGINVQDLALKNPVDQMAALAEAMRGVTNETQRLGILSQLGGDQFQWLNQLLRLGEPGIRARMQEAARVGAVLTPEQARQAAEASAAFARAWAAVKATFQSVGAQLLPGSSELSRFADAAVNAAAGVRELIGSGGQLVRSLAPGLAAAAGNLGTNAQNVLDVFAGGEFQTGVQLAGLMVENEWEKVTTRVRSLWKDLAAGLEVIWSDFRANFARGWLTALQAVKVAAAQALDPFNALGILGKAQGGFADLGKDFEAIDARNKRERGEILGRNRNETDERLKALEFEGEALARLGAEAAATANAVRAQRQAEAAGGGVPQAVAVALGTIRAGLAGGFGGLGQRFGVGDSVGQQMLAAQRQTAQNTAEISDKIDKLGLVAT